MKILKYFTLAALTVALMTSCDSNNSNSQTFNMSMLYYTTSASGEAYSLGTTEFKLDYSNVSKCAITSNNVMLPGSNNSMSFKFEDLILTGTNSGFKLVSGSAASDKVTCSIDGPWMNTMYTMDDGSISMLAMNRAPIFYSITNVVSSDSEESPFTTSQADKNLYMISINEADINTDRRSLDFMIDNAQFKTDMNESVQLKGISFKIVGDRLSFSANELPVYLKASSTASQLHKVLNLRASGKIGGDYSVSFVWQETDAEGATTDYNVSATLKTLLSSQTTPTN